MIAHPTLGAFRILDGFKYRSAGDVVQQVEGQPSYTRSPGFSPQQHLKWTGGLHRPAVPAAPEMDAGGSGLPHRSITTDLTDAK